MFLLLIMFNNFPKVFSIMKHTIWLSFDAKQVTLCSCCRPPTISLQTSSFHTLEDPIHSPIPRGSPLIHFLTLGYPESPCPTCSITQISVTSKSVFKPFSIQFSINSPSLIFPEANHKIIFKNHALYCSIEVQFQSYASFFISFHLIPFLLH